MLYHLEFTLHCAVLSNGAFIEFLVDSLTTDASLLSLNQNRISFSQKRNLICKEKNWTSFCTLNIAEERTHKRESKTTRLLWISPWFRFMHTFREKSFIRFFFDSWSRNTTVGITILKVLQTLSSYQLPHERSNVFFFVITIHRQLNAVMDKKRVHFSKRNETISTVFRWKLKAQMR